MDDATRTSFAPTDFQSPFQQAAIAPTNQRPFEVKTFPQRLVHKGFKLLKLFRPFGGKLSGTESIFQKLGISSSGAGLPYSIPFFLHKKEYLYGFNAGHLNAFEMFSWDLTGCWLLQNICQINRINEEKKTAT